MTYWGDKWRVIIDEIIFLCDIVVVLFLLWVIYIYIYMIFCVMDLLIFIFHTKAPNDDGKHNGFMFLPHSWRLF